MDNDSNIDNDDNIGNDMYNHNDIDFLSYKEVRFISIINMATMK